MDVITQDVIPTQDRQRGLSALIKVAMTGSVMYGTVLGSTLTSLYLLSLGARPFYIGLMGMLFALSPLVNLLGVKIMPALGKVRLTIYGRMLCLFPIAAMFVMAGLGYRGPWAIPLAMATSATLSMMYNIAHTGWWPLIQDNLADDAMGTYFARMRTRLRGVEVGVPIIVGWYLGSRPPLQKFLLPYSMALGAILIGTWFMRHIPERPSGVPRVGLGLRLRLAFRTRSVRAYLIYICAFCMVIAMLWPFWVVMLKSRGLPERFVMWMLALAAIGHVMGLKLWAWMVDRHGGRPSIALSVVGLGLLGLAWLTLPWGHNALIVWVIAYYLLFGFLDGGSLMGRTWAMMRAIPDVYQADGFTLVTIFGAIGGAVGALIGGAAFDKIDRLAKAGFFPSFIDGPAVYLCLVQLGLIGVYLLSRKLWGHEKQTPARHLLAQAWRGLVGGGE